jgi:hypothetical protein
VMTQVSCGTRRAAIANWWWRRDRTAMFGRHANTWLIIATTYHQNWLPIIPDNSQVGKLSRIIGKNWNPDNYRFFPTHQSLPIIPDFSREAHQTMESHLVESCSIFEVFREMPNSWHSAECPRGPVANFNSKKNKMCLRHHGASLALSMLLPWPNQVFNGTVACLNITCLLLEH